MFNVIAAQPSENLLSGAADIIALVVLGAVAVAGPFVALLRREANRRRQAEQALVEARRALEASANAAGAGGGVSREVHAQRESIAFEQHRRLNDLAYRKMGLEVQALEVQLKLMESDLRRRDEAGEHAEAALQKVRLEIDSLRLHIREQRKRVDDYGQFDE
ncbi:MAG: hypothetical protein SFY69_06395 [Planctomycetota bacterium]|nr:hypothetical protein [Planctomycetota bacterium]